jgi:hypothetical protein
MVGLIGAMGKHFGQRNQNAIKQHYNKATTVDMMLVIVITRTIAQSKYSFNCRLGITSCDAHFREGVTMKSYQQKYDEATERNVRNINKPKYSKGHTLEQVKSAMGIKQVDTRFDNQLSSIIGGVQ